VAQSSQPHGLTLTQPWHTCEPRGLCQAEESKIPAICLISVSELRRGKEFMNLPRRSLRLCQPFTHPRGQSATVTSSSRDGISFDSPALAAIVGAGT